MKIGELVENLKLDAETFKQYGNILAYCLLLRHDIRLKITQRSFFFCMAQLSLVGQGHLITEASRSHSDTSRSLELLTSGDQPDAETSNCTAHNNHKRQTFMPPAGFEPTIPASEWPQTHALDVVATEIGTPFIMPSKCTFVISTNIKSASATCVGVSYVYHFQGEHNSVSYNQMHCSP